MRPSAFSYILVAQAALLESCGARDVVGDLRALAEYFDDAKQVSVKAALPSSRARTARPSGEMGKVLGLMSDLCKAVQSSSKAPEDLQRLAEALAESGLSVREAIERWRLPKPPKPPKPTPDSSAIVDQLVAAKSAGDVEAGRTLVAKLASARVDVLKKIVTDTSKVSPPSRAKKADLLALLRRPFDEQEIAAGKGRAIKAAGTL